MVFSGTTAVYGHGRAVVTATGMHTEMGRIAGLQQKTPDETTPLQKELARTGKALAVAVVLLGVLPGPVLSAFENAAVMLVGGAG